MAMEQLHLAGEALEEAGSTFSKQARQKTWLERRIQVLESKLEEQGNSSLTS